MPTRRHLVWTAAAGALAAAAALVPGRGQNSTLRRRAVATFSIIADFVRNVAGERIQLATLVGPNGDVHVYTPTPGDVKTIATADIVFVSGLGLEGWLDRLIAAAAARTPVVFASRGVKPRSERGATDPHAWQSVANAKIYVANIRDGLNAADPAAEKIYQDEAATYLTKLDDLDAGIRAAIEGIPRARRKVITAHSAFGYFGDTYGIEFVAAEGLSTEAEPSAGSVAKLIAQIRREKIPAVFMENITDPRLAQRIAEETGAKIGSILYSDALSPPDGPAGTYIEMMRSNVRALTSALTS